MIKATTFDSEWQPTKIRSVYRVLPTSTHVAEVETDAGPAFVKVLGNPEGPHALARELVGTILAARLGLRTLTFSLVEVEADYCFEIQSGKRASPGRAYATQKLEGAYQWSGDSEQLERLDNQADLAGLVVADTWLRNRDRFPPISQSGERLRGGRPNYDNVLLAHAGGRKSKGHLDVLAIDFTHCLPNSGDLSARISDIFNVQDECIFGCFPEFRKFITRDSVVMFAKRLAGVTREDVRAAVRAIPADWQVEPAALDAIEEFLIRRAEWLAPRIVDMLARLCYPQLLLEYPEGNL